MKTFYLDVKSFYIIKINPGRTGLGHEICSPNEIEFLSYTRHNLILTSHEKDAPGGDSVSKESLHNPRNFIFLPISHSLFESSKSIEQQNKTHGFGWASQIGSASTQ